MQKLKRLRNKRKTNSLNELLSLVAEGLGSKIRKEDSNEEMGDEEPNEEEDPEEGEHEESDPEEPNDEEDDEGEA